MIENRAQAERPILFSGPMVRAILEGRKTQTRRVVRWPTWANQERDWPALLQDRGLALYEDGRPRRTFVSPYGVPGDRLWVRETWGYRGGCWSTSEPDIYRRTIAYRADDSQATIIRPAEDETGIPKQVCRCKAPEGGDERDGPTDEHLDELTRYWKSWRPAIHMPRWASRLTLEVTDVRVQWLGEISEDDAKAEGVRRDNEPCDHKRQSCADVGCLGRGYRSTFCEVWDSINSERAPWASNPWVWVISFRKEAA